jgi:hypothetical protein
MRLRDEALVMSEGYLDGEIARRLAAGQVPGMASWLHPVPTEEELAGTYYVTAKARADRFERRRDILASLPQSLSTYELTGALLRDVRSTLGDAADYDRRALLVTLDSALGEIARLRRKLNRA